MEGFNYYLSELEERSLWVLSREETSVSHILPRVHDVPRHTVDVSVHILQVLSWTQA